MLTHRSHARRIAIGLAAAVTVGVVMTGAPATASVLDQDSATAQGAGARGGWWWPGHGDSSPQPTSVGYGGAVSSVDESASRIGLEVLKHGGNAADAAVATASALGVTEPYSAGIGGGGYFV